MAQRTPPRPLSAFAAGLAASHKPKAMWAVLIEVDVAGVPRDVGLQALREQIIPSIKALPGFQPLRGAFRAHSPKMLIDALGIWAVNPSRHNDIDCGSRRGDSNP
jgi:hypothetical protein